LLPAWGDIPLIDSLIDAVRSYSAGFIFRTALPPPICAAATAAIRHLKASNWGRERHQERAARVKAVLNAAALPVTPSDTHIVSVLVGGSGKVQGGERSVAHRARHLYAADQLSLPCRSGTERPRITPSLYHDDALSDALAEARVDVWPRVGLALKH
jgi:5-aminolevulinate synthase